MRSRRWVIPVMALIFWGLPILAYATATLILPTHNDNGQCEGLGWGCSPTPADTLRLVVLAGAPVWVIAGAVAMLVAAWIQARRSSPAARSQ